MVQKYPHADLRAQSRTIFEAGLAVALIIVIAAFTLFPEIRVSTVAATQPDPPIQIVAAPITEHFLRPPPPARPPLIIEAPPDEELGDFTFDTGLIHDADVPPPPLPDGDEAWFEAVEEPPKPMGGSAALQGKVDYPEMAKKLGIEGTVVVLAYVEKDGTVSKTEILKGIGFGCDESAAQAVAGTRFTPGLQRDRPVRVKIAVPLRFSLRR